jgi:dipeptidyl aminopeptidase/acylaminoacyl peptidase
MEITLKYMTLLFLGLTLNACGDDSDKSGGDVQISASGFERLAAARFNPNGTRLAMVGQNGDAYALISTDDTGGDVQVLAPDGLDYLSAVAWTSDGSTVYYSGDDGILRVTADGNSAPELVVDDFAVMQIDISPDGQSLAYSTNGGVSIRLADLRTFESTPIQSETTATSGSGPRFSPNGARVVYASGENFKFADVGFMTEVDGPTGADYLANAAWIDDKTIIYLGDDKIRTWADDGRATALRDAFAGMDLDFNAATNRYIYGTNGSPSLTIAEY